MRHHKTYQENNILDFKLKLLHYAGRSDRFSYLESNASIDHSNNRGDRYTAYDCIVALDPIDEITISDNTAFESLKRYHDDNKDWLFGFLSYDLKNETEQLLSDNYDGIEMPLLHFFRPKYVFLISGNEVTVAYSANDTAEQEVEDTMHAIRDESIPDKSSSIAIQVEPRISKKEYLNAASKLKEHIKYGDIYEVNYCQEFYSVDADIDPLQTYVRLNEITKAPFSCCYRFADKYLISASPERFLQKKGMTLISQPIKGTMKRGENEEIDLQLKNDLLENPKEQRENVMIVDLVRNDLSRTAKKGSVEVEELFGIYTFQQAHQMISTVRSELKEDVHFVDAIMEAFPMGSMTGAPKVSAMKLIEKYEETKRGLYSGAVGYITPDGDFDFNVVIRSILYNKSEQYLSFIVGGAITDLATIEDEHEECLLKAKPMFEVLNSHCPF